MASKSRRGAASRASNPPETPAPSTSMGRPSSPLSPTKFNRLQEKVELQNLNDRLAVYIDRVRQLESENTRLSRQIESYHEVSSREVTNIKSMYEQELAEARKLLDDTSREKAKMEIDLKRLWEDGEEAKKNLEKKTKDCAIFEKAANLNEVRFNDISGKYNQLVVDKKKLSDDNKELEKENDKLKKSLADTRQQLEEEMLSRVEAENRLQTAKEELNLKEQIFNQEIKEVRTKRQVEISEIDSRLGEEYNAKLQLSLQELRDQYEAQMRANREDIEVLYENKMRDMKNQMQKNSGATSQAMEELRQYKMQIDTIATARANLAARVQELERSLELEREKYVQDMSLVEADCQRMREEMAAQLSEYQDLMDIKVALDLEIAAYQKLLESEEARLNITPMASPNIQQQQRYTPVRRTPGRGGKRRRIYEESEEHLTDEYGTKSTATTDVEISEACPQGRFVKLHNKGNKEAAIGSWQLSRKAGEKETSFKFHRTVKIDPGATITVWSSDQGQTHEPPVNIVMKGQKWFVANTMSTALHNNEGEEVATLEQERLALSTATLHHREMGGDEELYFQRGDPQARDERCCIV